MAGVRKNNGAPLSDTRAEAGNEAAIG
jgi:hypothetical protein